MSSSLLGPSGRTCTTTTTSLLVLLPPPPSRPSPPPPSPPRRLLPAETPVSECRARFYGRCARAFYMRSRLCPGPSVAPWAQRMTSSTEGRRPRWRASTGRREGRTSGAAGAPADVEAGRLQRWTSTGGREGKGRDDENVDEEDSGADAEGLQDAGLTATVRERLKRRGRGRRRTVGRRRR